MNELRIFESADFGQIRVSGTSEEPLFNANDVCAALGLGNPRDAVMRHVDDDDVVKTDTIDSKGRRQNANFVNESGLYALIFGSTKEEAKKFKHYVTSEVLPSIRKTGEYQTPAKKRSMSKHQVEARIALIKGFDELLHINDASKALMLNSIADEMGAPKLDYTTSKGILKSATELLKANGIKMSAKQFNLKMLAKGILKKITRPSSKGEKTFYAITDEGRVYGENQVSPYNPKETQPLWYADMFVNLLSA